MPPSPNLPKMVQLLIVVSVAAAVAVFFGLKTFTGWLAGKSDTESAETQSPKSESSFRPTDSQWQSLKIEAVQLKTFQNRHRTDGKIANDDDATTPVLSPYSGRVSKLFVKAGDEVKQGQPLLGVEAQSSILLKPGGQHRFSRTRTTTRTRTS
jgi:membrane fusion protein, heavy metal efflux system